MAIFDMKLKQNKDDGEMARKPALGKKRNTVVFFARQKIYKYTKNYTVENLSLFPSWNSRWATWLQHCVIPICSQCGLCWARTLLDMILLQNLPSASLWQRPLYSLPLASLSDFQLFYRSISIFQVAAGARQHKFKLLLDSPLESFYYWLWPLVCIC